MDPQKERKWKFLHQQSRFFCYEEISTKEILDSGKKPLNLL
jgi:hypothetical protein